MDTTTVEASTADTAEQFRSTYTLKSLLLHMVATYAIFGLISLGAYLIGGPDAAYKASFLAPVAMMAAVFGFFINGYLDQRDRDLAAEQDQPGRD